MDAPLDIRNSDDFETSWGIATYELGSRAEEFDKKLAAAVDKLWRERPGFGVPAQSAEHSVAVMGRYELVYEWATDFNIKGVASRPSPRPAVGPAQIRGAIKVVEAC